MPQPRRCRPSLSVPGFARPARPAERLGADAVALQQSVARPGQAGMLVAVGDVAPAQLDRVEVELISQLVQRRFQREAARSFARRPRRVGLRRVHAHQAVRGGDVGAGVHHARRRRDRIGVLAVGRGLRHGVVHEGGEAPVARGADAQPLHRLLPPADQGEHLRACELQPHRAAELLCRQAGQHQAGDPGAAFRAEAAAEIRRDHPHARDVEAKTLRQRGAVGEHRLRRRVHGEVAAVPLGQHHLRLDGQVVVRRRGVAPLERSPRPRPAPPPARRAGCRWR